MKLHMKIMRVIRTMLSASCSCACRKTGVPKRRSGVGGWTNKEVGCCFLPLCRMVCIVLIGARLLLPPRVGLPDVRNCYDGGVARLERNAIAAAARGMGQPLLNRFGSMAGLWEGDPAAEPPYRASVPASAD